MNKENMNVWREGGGPKEGRDEPQKGKRAKK